MKTLITAIIARIWDHFPDSCVNNMLALLRKMKDVNGTLSHKATLPTKHEDEKGWRSQRARATTVNYVTTAVMIMYGMCCVTEWVLKKNTCDSIPAAALPPLPLHYCYSHGWY